MRYVILTLALLGGIGAGTTAQAAAPVSGQAAIQPVYWSGDYCGPRCQEHRWWNHRRWESHRRWEERRYGYRPYYHY
jgi:hypothetical protein